MKKWRIVVLLWLWGHSKKQIKSEKIIVNHSLLTKYYYNPWEDKAYEHIIYVNPNFVCEAKTEARRQLKSGFWLRWWTENRHIFNSLLKSWMFLESMNQQQWEEWEKKQSGRHVEAWRQTWENNPQAAVGRCRGKPHFNTQYTKLLNAQKSRGGHLPDADSPVLHLQADFRNASSGWHDQIKRAPLRMLTRVTLQWS